MMFSRSPFVGNGLCLVFRDIFKTINENCVVYRSLFLFTSHLVSFLDNVPVRVPLGGKL